MNRRQFLKQLIKDLSQRQKEAKYAVRGSHKTDAQIAIKARLVQMYKETYGINWIDLDITRNKAKITAALNLYHMIRGSKYRHHVSKHWAHMYPKYLQQIEEKVFDIAA
jgi:hypothetical protein